MDEDNASGGRSSTFSADHPLVNHEDIHRIDIFGWRKRCLYISLLLLTVLLVVNLLFILWVIKVLDLSKEGMGKLRILERGIRSEGPAEFLRPLYTKHIKNNAEMSFQSARNLTLKSRNLNGEVTTSLFLGDKRLQADAAQFTVKSSTGKTLFFAGDDRVEVFADTIKLSGTGGAVFQSSVQTTSIDADYRNDLKIESPTRSLEIEARMGVSLDSPSGSFSATCLTDQKLQSIRGTIKLDAEKLYVEKLPEAVSQTSLKNYKDIFQMCACDNGRLFLAPSHGHCYADPSTCK